MSLQLPTTQAMLSKSSWISTTTGASQPTTLHPQLPTPALAPSPLLAFLQHWKTTWLKPSFAVAQHSFYWDHFPVPVPHMGAQALEH